MTASADSIPRHDMYLLVHKGLRAFLNHTLDRVGRIDANDRAEVEEVLAGFRALCYGLRSHVHHEDHFVHAAMEARQPGSAATKRAEHVHHLAAIDRLQTLAGAVAQAAQVADTVACARAAATLYAQLGLFVAENLTHMHEEETANNAVLWANYTDAELLQIEASLVASIPPVAMGAFLRWTLPAITAAERASFVAGVAHTAPREVLEGVLAVARAHLSPRDWYKLQHAIGPLPLAA